ncbi:MAG: GDP-mannose 4,6-dehydratase [Chloroflexi bacterium]|nr:GDP-mannose 4,6-dehydratase [Chloroflexota bacterium]
MSVLITGSEGFCGQHLARYCVTLGEKVTGIARKIHSNQTNPAWDTIENDLSDTNSLISLLDQLRPEVIYHLAGTFDSSDPTYLYALNVQATIRLFDAVTALAINPVIMIASSGAVYGRMSSATKAIQEQNPFCPLTHYAVSKIAQEMVALRYHLSEKVRVIRTRAFNIIGPGQPENLVCSSLAKQIAAIELNRQDPVIRVGNLTPARDLIDVRDVVNAYWLVANRGESGKVYNVCSGRAMTVAECLDTLKEFSQVPSETIIDPTRQRADDIPIQVGDPSRITHETGWRAQISFRQSLLDLLNYWRERLQKES